MNTLPDHSVQWVVPGTNEQETKISWTMMDNATEKIGRKSEVQYSPSNVSFHLILPRSGLYNIREIIVTPSEWIPC